MGITHFSIHNTHPDVDCVAVCNSSALMLKNIRRYAGIDTFTD